MAEAQLPGLRTDRAQAALRLQPDAARASAGGRAGTADVPVTWHPRGRPARAVTSHVAHTERAAVSPPKTLALSPNPQAPGVRPLVETGL